MAPVHGTEAKLLPSQVYATHTPGVALLDISRH